MSLSCRMEEQYTKKSVIFLHILNEQSDIEIKITFNRTQMFRDKYDKVYSRSIHCKLRNMAEINKGSPK